MPQPPPLPTPKAFLESLLNNLPTSNSATTSTPLPPTSKTPLLTLHAFFPTLLLPALDLLDRRLLTRFAPKPPPNAEEATTTTPTKPDHDPQSVDDNKSERRRIVYYALSTTTSHSRHSRRLHTLADPTTSYEIRPHAWSCTCPAFTFAAYNNAPSPYSPITYGEGEWDDSSWSRAKVADFGTVNHQEEEDDDAMMLDVPTEEAVRDDIIGTIGDIGHGHEWWGGLMRVEGGDGEEVPLCKHLLACVLAERWGVVRGMVEEREVGREEMAGWAAGWGG